MLVRAELNVSLSPQGRILDDSRLTAVIPTLRLLKQRGARIVIATHLGRPDGRVVRTLSTRCLVRSLERALRTRVTFVPESIGPLVERAVERCANGEIVLLENVRFHAEEELDDPGYARRMASLADLEVLECFGTAHRKHASVVGVGRYIPVVAGLRFMEEVKVLSKVMARPKRPLVAVLGGAKISTKMGLIESLLTYVDALLLGGALANTILKAKGLNIGASLNEPTMVRSARLLQLTDTKLHIPVDVMVSGPKVRAATRAVGNVAAHENILDVGPDTVALYGRVLRSAGTIIWNGPMGMFEKKPFDRGTVALARIVARSPGFSVVGGGETVDALERAHVARSIDFISTGGGAMMEFLEGKHLPGVELVREYR